MVQLTVGKAGQNGVRSSILLVMSFRCLGYDFGVQNLQLNVIVDVQVFFVYKKIFLISFKLEKSVPTSSHSKLCGRKGGYL